MKIDFKKYQRYLPSKKFAYIAGAIFVLGFVIFLIFFMSSGGENFSLNKNGSPLQVENKNFADLVQKDSDGDGVPDWEEALWGTDKNNPATFGMPDSEYIANKKKELKIESSVNETKLTETEKFARDFFASYSLMKSSGGADKNAINDFSNALGQKAVNPNLPDKYGEADAKTINSEDLASKQAYYNSVRNLFKNYQSAGLGEELSIISGQLKNSQGGDLAADSSKNEKLISIANAYEEFAKKLMGIGVPKSLLDYHLRIANNSNNTGISVANMAKMANDPLVGLAGLSQYQKYSDGLIKSVSDLEASLKQ